MKTNLIAFVAAVDGFPACLTCIHGKMSGVGELYRTDVPPVIKHADGSAWRALRVRDEHGMSHGLLAWVAHVIRCCLSRAVGAAIDVEEARLGRVHGLANGIAILAGYTGVVFTVHIAKGIGGARCWIALIIVGVLVGVRIPIVFPVRPR